MPLPNKSILGREETMGNNNIANNAKKQKFIDLLHELFQLNQPELDFGLYRIMHAKSGQIKAFIENDLSREIDDAFASGGDDKVVELKAAYEQARAQAKEFGIDDPDANPKVKEAKEAYDAAREGGDDPSDIYDHLYRFLSRYYDKGDFLSRRYHVAEKGQHHHLVCHECGKTIDLEDSALLPLIDLLAHEYGFAADLRHLAISGRCSSCRHKREES